MTETAYLFLVVVEEAAVLLAVVSIFIPVSIAAGAGAIAGAVVSDVAASSFFELHAASARTATTRARRFIYDLLERQTWNKSPVRARDRGARFGAGENLSHLAAVSRAQPSGRSLKRGLD
jgi:hypothetical protein